MSSTGAIPKGGARPKLNISVQKDPPELTGEPLEKRFLTVTTKGVEDRIPALHTHWVEQGVYIKYDPPPLPHPDGSFPPGAREAWQEQMEYLEQDLNQLLTLPHHRFWSQVVHDQGVHECLESYLSQGPRWYDDQASQDDFARPVVEAIHQLVFLVFMRMATYRESKTCHITASVFGELIYNHFLFDVCKILDICVVYGPNNPELIAKMVSNIFTNQPKYYNDLKHSLSSIKRVLDNVERKLNVAEKGRRPKALGHVGDPPDLEELHDISLYLLDTFHSLHALLHLHPPAAHHFSGAEFEIRLASCYERIVPALSYSLEECVEEQEVWAAQVGERVGLARALMLATFRRLVDYQCFQPLRATDNPSASLVETSLEQFLHIMSTSIEEKVFVADYGNMYPVKHDSEFIETHGGDVTTLVFIMDAIESVMLELGVTRGVDMSVTKGVDMGVAKGVAELSLHDKEKTQPEDSMDVDGSGMNGYARTGEAEPSDVEMASMVSSVLDLLPQLGSGFVQQCLKYYSYSTEEVINAMLEDNLPPSLAALDRTSSAPAQPAPPTPSEDEAEPQPQVSAATVDRKNVYDNDEFDVFSRRSVDRDKVYKGKRPKRPEEYKPDNSAIDKVKELARMYDERGGTSIYEDEFRYEDESQHAAWDYDDEYDDTYDDNETGDIDNFDRDKVRRRPGLIGAGALNRQFHYAEESEESEDDSTSSQPKVDLVHSSDAVNGHPGGARPKSRGGGRGNTRGVQRMQQRGSSKPGAQQNGRAEEQQNDGGAAESSNNDGPPRLGFMPFCENPEDVRRRKEQWRQSKEANRSRPQRGQYNGPPAADTSNGARPKVSLSSNKNSGKQWRHGEGGDDDRRKYHGGKYKEDTNHGKAQSREHRNKMVHKNEHKRQGAQAKFNRNN